MRFTVLLTVAVLVVTASVLTAAALAASHGGAVVKVGQSAVGRVLVDSRGKTLYMWAHDKGSRSTCYGTCASYWPPLTTAGKPIARSGAKTGCSAPPAALTAECRLRTAATRSTASSWTRSRVRPTAKG
jgi:predicted lipoprotein with Yx(FWY)xxD motif